jgi:hypothetical protein
VKNLGQGLKESGSVFEFVLLGRKISCGLNLVD